MTQRSKWGKETSKDDHNFQGLALPKRWESRILKKQHHHEKQQPSLPPKKPFAMNTDLFSTHFNASDKQMCVSICFAPGNVVPVLEECLVEGESDQQTGNILCTDSIDVPTMHSHSRMTGEATLTQPGSELNTKSHSPFTGSLTVELNPGLPNRRKETWVDQGQKEYVFS